MNTGLERVCSKRREFGCVYKIALRQQRSTELHNCEALKYWGERAVLVTYGGQIPFCMRVRMG